MTKITAIEAQKKNANRVSVFVNEQFFMGISLYTCKKMKLKVGMEINESEIQKILIEEEFEDMKIYLTKYCADKPEKIIRQKLKQRQYNENNIERLIAFAYRYNFIDETRYANAFAHDKSKFAKHGKKKIQQALRQKGIDSLTIEQALEKIDDKEQIEMACRKLQTKLSDYKRKSNDPYTFKNKCRVFLMRAGFEKNVIDKVFEELNI